MQIIVKNKKALFEFSLLETFEAGIVLLGSEIKSIRAGKANLQEAFCLFDDGELFIRGLHIAEYTHGGYANHEPLRQRKLLLKRTELKKLQQKLKEKGLTIVPIKLYLNDKGLAKLEIALAKGKKLYDKRETIKARDIKKQLDSTRKQLK
ncbi:MAG: SsrA-binding protein SmpB [Flavobacteriales bacterium]|nr:SsrA-binding protein SmpB [Flavobacteriales bacterium]MCZ2443218.1 SsrA-binding protein SmpB [Flavobacteriales bacterium]